MKLKELFDLIPELQKVHLLCGDLDVVGSECSMSCMLNDEVLNMEVVNIESEDDKIKIWVKEEWRKRN